jgi:hypothetical protein
MTQRFTITIQLLEPAALTEGSSDAGGGHTSLPYIPGTSILGAFVGALGVPPGTSLFSRAFLSSTTRFLNAYPAAGGTRTLPRPLTYRVGKVSKSRVHDAIDDRGTEIQYEALQAYFLHATPPDAMKATRLAMISPIEPGVDLSPERIEQVHVGIDRTTRAAFDGVLFTYEAVRGGSTFVGAVETEDPEVAAIFRKHAACELRIGRSRSAGYGAARATIIPADNWREYEQKARPAPAPVIVTLLSDYLPHLECAPIEALRRELAAAAGVSADSVGVCAASLRKVRGFRGIWGLPRPARTGVAKGSVFVIDSTVNSAQLASSLASGIGARTNEGFGRVAVDWQVHGQTREGSRTRAARATARLTRPSLAGRGLVEIPALKAIAARRSDRLIHDFVAAVLQSKRATDAAKALVRVPPSQLGNLRAAVSGGMSEKEIGDWFRSLGGKTAGERWKRVSVPSLLKDEPVRAGHAFVWQSLLGGQVDDQDRFVDAAVGPEAWKALVTRLAGSVASMPPATRSAAESRAGDTVRLVIAGMVSNTARLRSQKLEVES